MTKPPTPDSLITQALAEGTLLVPCGRIVRLHRLDDHPPSDELVAGLKAAGPAEVADHLRDLGRPYLGRLLAVVADHGGEDLAQAVAREGLWHAAGAPVEVYPS